MTRFLEESSAYCLGTKDVDVTRSVNGIAVGECVEPEGNDVVKVPCGGADDELRVLLVLKDQPRAPVGGADELSTACIAAGAGETDTSWAWSLDSTTDRGPRQWDRVLCLTDNQ